jgi:hypothetical protein
MVNKVGHLLRVEQLEDTGQPAAKRRTRRARNTDSADET